MIAVRFQIGDELTDPEDQVARGGAAWRR